MTTQQLIYETVVPVSAGRHAKCSLEKARKFGFTRNLNSMPLLAAEFAEAQPEYAVVFAGDADSTMPAVILGSRQKENLFLDAEDAWGATYVPAFLRRYPFVFSKSEDGKTFNLCVDETFTGLNYQARGSALFEADGKPSAFTENVLKFLENYRVQFLRTQTFCKKLRELELLQPMQAEFTINTEEKRTLSGFLGVDRVKLKALSANASLELLRNDGLELIYLHLQSLHNFTTLKDRLTRAEHARQKQTSEALETTVSAMPQVLDWISGESPTQH